ncbi:MAG: GNAT family N-acetyltransferase [Planctomycetota bacterium]
MGISGASTASQDLGRDARALIERVMGDGRAIAAESPLVFETGRIRPPGRLVALSDGNAVLSACAILVREVRTAESTTRVGLIGWVSTAPEARGRGLASRILAEAEQQLRSRGCRFALLWANDAEFYRRRGYTEVGGEVDLPLDASTVERLPVWSDTRRLDPDRDAAATLSLYRTHTTRCRRTLAEHAALLHTPGMRARVALADGRVVAYACEGRGGDLQGVVHEWAGATKAVLGLQRELASDAIRRSGSAFVIAPSLENDVVRAWMQSGLRVEIGNLGMARSLHDEDMNELLPPSRFDGSLSASLASGFMLWGLDSI